MVDEIVLSRLDDELLAALESGDWMTRAEITKKMGKPRWYGSWEPALTRLEKMNKVEIKQSASKVRAGLMQWHYRVKS